MIKRSGIISCLLLLITNTLFAQDSSKKKYDSLRFKAVSSKAIHEVIVTGFRAISGMGFLNDLHDNLIYSGKKTELITLDSINANTAQNNPRQILGRIPGANFSETEYNGFPSNGIAFRGLNPVQSIELEIRQNGYNIAGDIYGYPESYYMPPLQATEKIEITRGASSLQYGPQFGGVVNYIIKSVPITKLIEFNTEQTAGSYGLYSSFNSVGGTVKKFAYYAYLQYEGIDGWRSNSNFKKITGFGRLEYNASEKFKIALEYSMLRNSIHMPGGLSDSTYNLNARQSFRSRNWLTTPWNIIALNASYKASARTTITFKSAFNFSQRNLVWRNEDGGPDAPDSLINGKYQPREAEHEGFKSLTTEIRSLTNYSIGGRVHSLAAGVRIFSGHMTRGQKGPGSDGTGLDLNLYKGTYGNNLIFTTFNIAPYFENTFHVGSRLAITPGLRFEYIKSAARGYVTPDSGSVIRVNTSIPRYIVLAGIGFQFNTGASTNIYANISQAYRPIEYSFQYPLGLNVNVKIDPKLKDISGYNADLGFRGSINGFMNFDVGTFYLRKNREIALETLADGSKYETNVADAVHKGLETYLELNLTKLINASARYGAVSIFNSLAYDRATYVNGIYKGNLSAFAPAIIERLGMTYNIGGISTTYLISNTGKSFSDANNTHFSHDAEVGIIPGYQITDWSASIRVKNVKVKFGVNNLYNKKYFTMRTGEYPGPGIIPSIGRSMYLGFSAKF